MSRISLFPRQSRLSSAVRGALAILALGAAASAWAAGAGDAPAFEAGAAAPLAVTVQPGQSLNDIAIAVTQSHDPVVLARAGRALFDANPQAFMKRDPSRLKVGATLTVPTLDATGAALAATAASGAASAAGPAGVTAGAASATHPASAPRPASVAPSASTSAAHAVPVTPTASAAVTGHASDSHAAAVAGVAATGASAVASAPAAHGASGAGAQPASPVAGASGPHVWSGAIQSEPSSASDAAVSATQGGAAAGLNAATAASQPRPSSLQQLLTLKNRVLMELQKHGIGKPAATGGATGDTGRAQAPSAPRPAASDAGASAAASSAGEAAASDPASAPQPATPPAQPAIPVTAQPAASTAGQVDWRAASAAGAAAVVLAAGFVWRKRRKARRDEAGAAAAAGVPSGGDAKPSVVEALPIQPEMPLSRDAAADAHLAAATAAAAETVDTHEPDALLSPPGTERSAHDVPSPAADKLAGEPSGEPSDGPSGAPSEPQPSDAQHAILQNAITALGGLDMPLPPRAPGESLPAAFDEAAGAGLSAGDSNATNGQAASRPPIGAGDSTLDHRAGQDDELEWDADTMPHGQSGIASATSALPPLGGAQFGALKLDFDLELPAAPGAVLPALTPEELARIARNKLDLAAEYVELGDLSGARTLLQEVVDANDAATRDDARALLAKLADAA